MAAFTPASCESASTPGWRQAAMFSGVRWTLLTNWSRQMTLATGSASGCAFGTLVGIADDLRPDLGRDVALDEVVDLVEPGERADLGARRGPRPG